MKLHELKLLESKTFTFVVKDWDGNEPKDAYIEPFDVLVTYEVEDFGHSDHPYGEGTARENHGKAVNVLSMKANQVVELKNEEGDKVLKTFPKGTDIESIPGWDKKSAVFFQQKADEEVD